MIGIEDVRASSKLCALYHNINHKGFKMFTLLDIEDFSSDNNNSKKSIVKESKELDTYKSHRGMLVFKPEDKYYTIDELRTMLIDFEMKQYLYDNKHTRENMKKFYPNIK